MSGGSILVYLMRRDLRTSDNPILHKLSNTDHDFTHLLPVYVLPPDQIEVSGLVKHGKTSPYPSARYHLSQRWKCGHLRAKFIAETLWDLKGNLENLGSGLAIRVGTFDGVLNGIIKHYAANSDGPKVTTVWMTEDHSPDQDREEESISAVCDAHGIKFRRFWDVKYFMHDLQLFEYNAGIGSLPDDFNVFRQALVTRAEEPFDPFPQSTRSSLPSYPDRASLPPLESPFEIPDTLEELIRRLQGPVQLPMPHLDGADFRRAAVSQILPGGETCARQRIRYITQKGIVSSYHLLSDDVPVGDGHHGLQSYLALGCITARQVHQELLKLECGTDPGLARTVGFGRGRSPGTESIRHYLLRLNFIRLSIIKYRRELYNLRGAGMGRNPFRKWKSPVTREPGRAIGNVVSMAQFLMGLTGFGLVDAIMRQLYVTGQMTARGEEVAIGFFASYAGLDWRYGAEYVSSLSTDHDPFFHHYMAQNCAGVGPNFKTQVSKLCPAHVSRLVDPDCAFIRKWMPELRCLPARKNVFRVSTTAALLLQRHGLASSIMVTRRVPSATEAHSTTNTNASRPQMADTEALVHQRAVRRLHTADISTTESGSGDQSLLRMPPGLADHTFKTPMASTSCAPTPPAEANVLLNTLSLLQRLHHPAATSPLPQLLPSEPSLHHLGISASHFSSQSLYTTSLPPLRPQSRSPPLPARVVSQFPTYQRQSLSRHPSPAREMPNLPAAPTPPSPPSPPPPPPPQPTLSSAVPHLSDTPLVPLPRDQDVRDSIEDHLPFHRIMRRPRPRIAVIPHGLLMGFLPVVAEPEIIRYYIDQLLQNRYRASSNYRFIDIPFLDHNRIHIIPCPRGVVPLRGDPDFYPPFTTPEDIDLEALDELVDEVDDEEAAALGPRIGYGRGGPRLLRPFRPRPPSRFNSRFR